MADPSPPAGMMQGALPPNPPPWMPAGPPMARRMDMMSMMPQWSFILRIVGFLLLFVGTLVVVAFATPGGGCFSIPPNGGTPSCATGSNFNTGEWNALVAAKILWTIGLFALGAGAGLKMHFGLSTPTNGTPEQYRFVSRDRLFNGLLIILTIVLLWALMTGALIYSTGIG